MVDPEKACEHVDYGIQNEYCLTGEEVILGLVIGNG